MHGTTKNKPGIRTEITKTAALALAIVAVGVWTYLLKLTEPRSASSTDPMPVPGFAAESADNSREEAPAAPEDPSQA